MSTVELKRLVILRNVALLEGVKGEGLELGPAANEPGQGLWQQVPRVPPPALPAVLKISHFPPLSPLLFFCCGSGPVPL